MMRYAHRSPGFLQEAVNGGSLVGTGSSDQVEGILESAKPTEGVERLEELKWLGDQESNLGS